MTGSLNAEISGIQSIHAEEAIDAFDYFSNDTPKEDLPFRESLRLLFDDEKAACLRVKYSLSCPWDWVSAVASSIRTSSNERDRHVLLKIAAARLAEDLGADVARIPLQDTPRTSKLPHGWDWTYHGNHFEKHHELSYVHDFVNKDSTMIIGEVGYSTARKVATSGIGDVVDLYIYIPYSTSEWRKHSDSGLFDCYIFYPPNGLDNSTRRAMRSRLDDAFATVQA